MVLNRLTLHSISDSAGSSCIHSFHTTSTVTITSCPVAVVTYTFNSCTAVKISIKLVTKCSLVLVSFITQTILIRFCNIVNFSGTQTPTSGSDVQTPTSKPIVQTPTSCTCQQDVMWMIMAVLFLVVAVLLAITSIALGTMLCLTKKPVKSVPPSNLTLDQG